jgi:septum formation protein
LLGYLASEFDIRSADIDETPLDNEQAEPYVARMALEKANAIFNHHILGKPDDLNHSKQMLSMLSGKTHQVLTAFALVTSEGSVSKTVSTDVLFRELSEPEIEQYWNTGEPQDKAGSYAIQGIGGKFVKSISGSVSNVVGLPLVELEQELKNMGAL